MFLYTHCLNLIAKTPPSYGLHSVMYIMSVKYYIVLPAVAPVTMNFFPAKKSSIIFNSQMKVSTLILYDSIERSGAFSSSKLTVSELSFD